MGSKVLSDMYEDVALSDLSIAYTQDDFIADLVIPTVPVKKESAKYYVFGREHLRAEKTRRADGDEANEVTYTLSKDSYTCEEEALQDRVTDRQRENADDGVDPEISAVEILTAKLQLTREIQARDALFTAANYGTNTSVPSALWDTASSDPIEDVITAVRTVRQGCGHKPNKVVMGAAVYDVLRRNADILDAFGNADKKVVTREVLAQLFDVDEVIVGEAVQNTAAEGLAEVLANIWGKFLAVIYTPPRPGLKVPSVAYRFSTRNRQVMRWREDKRDSDYFRCSDIYTTKFTGSYCGYLYTGVIS